MRILLIFLNYTGIDKNLTNTTTFTIITQV